MYLAKVISGDSSLSHFWAQISYSFAGLSLRTRIHSSQTLRGARFAMRYYHVLTLQRWMKRKIELTKNLVFSSSFLCQCKHSGHSDRCVFHYRTWIFYYTVLISLRRSEFLFWSIIYRGPEIIGNFHFIVIFLLIIIYRGPETSGQSDLQCSLSSAWCKYAAVSPMFKDILHPTY